MEAITINEKNSCDNCFNILELYSGIGGFHFALQKLFDSIGFTNYKITAIDINTSANEVYRESHLKPSSRPNQHKHTLLERNIQSLTVDDFDKMKLNLLTMSPPCQPFSRLGLKKDLIDNRCDSFRHLMNIFPSMSHKPRFVMLENVKGFDNSDAHQMLIDTLITSGYVFEQYLLSPNSFSIPNSRQRYYLIACLREYCSSTSLSSLAENTTTNIRQQIPVIKSNRSIFQLNPSDELAYVERIGDVYANQIQINPVLNVETSVVGNYLETNDNPIIQTESNVISDGTLLRYHMLFDLVDCDSTNTNCFTKAYAHRVEGCGSVLKTSPHSVTIDTIYQSIDIIKSQFHQKQIDQQTYENKTIESLRSLQLRYFTPREIANLMCFPRHLEFPAHFNLKQKYRLLGNSVNVLVCYYLLRILLGLNIPVL